MIPHVIVLEPGLIIYKIYNGYWFFGRPTLEDLRQDLRVLTKKCRPDWNITISELKAAWQQGRKDLFYPYGKTYAQTIGEQGLGSRQTWTMLGAPANASHSSASGSKIQFYDRLRPRTADQHIPLRRRLEWLRGRTGPTPRCNDNHADAPMRE
jgi:hypothetical protein